MFINGAGEMYLNEDSYKFAKPVYEPFDRDKAYNMMANLCHRRNHWESMRKEFIK
jgi:hypothetical protein